MFAYTCVWRLCYNWNTKQTVNNNRNNNNKHHPYIRTQTHICRNDDVKKIFTTAEFLIDWRLWQRRLNFCSSRFFFRWHFEKNNNNNTRIRSTWFKPLLFYFFGFSCLHFSFLNMCYVYIEACTSVSVFVCLYIPISLNLIIIRLNWFYAIFLLPVHFSSI